MFNLNNLFNRRKDPRQQSAAPQMSVYRPSQNTRTPGQSPYKMASQNSSQTQRRTYAKVPNNPISQWGSQAVAGNGVQATQNIFRTPKVKTKPRTSVGPNMSSAIQGSGMSNRYASNPGNYRPKPVAQVQQPQAPQVQQAPQAAEAPQQSPLQRFTEQIGNIGNDRINFLNQQRQAGDEYIRNTYNNANQALMDQVPAARDAFNVFRDSTMAGLEGVQASGERQKDSARDYYGEAQRRAAQTRRETQGQTQRTFANLGTLDSYGEGSFKQSTENQDSEFNRFTQQTLKAQADKLATIDEAVSTAERQANTLIQQEALKLKQLESQIAAAVSQNRLDEAQSLREQYAATQDLIFQVQDTVAQLKYQQEVEQMNFDNALSQINAPMEGLSQEFMQTGKPQTQADFIFRMQNAGDMEKLFGEGFAQNQPGQMSAEKQNLVGLVDTLLGRNIKGITGAVRTGWVPGSGDAYTKSLYDQLQGLLSLESREKLKGTGAISDFEARVLANAASALNQNLSADDFTNELMKIKQQLGGSSGTPTMTAGAGNDPLGLGF